MNISRANTTVNTWLLTPRMYLSRDHGGMLGRSMARVMQFAEMKVRMMKSNQPWDQQDLIRSFSLQHGINPVPVTVPLSPIRRCLLLI